MFPGGPHFSELYISSYTPTLNALLVAQQGFRNPPILATVKVILASVEHTAYSHANDLHGTVAEISTIKEMLNNNMAFTQCTTNQLVVLHGAKSFSLRQELPEAGILHLASHGVQEPSDPLQSGFLMADAKLTILELMKLDLPKAYLAILSACHTARGDDKQPDQTVHLAATMLFLGFKSVVATMWYVLIFLIVLTTWLRS